jgi:predicted phosphodiesterase
MRLAVISDVHGNFRALQAVLADIDRAGVTGIIALGDNIGYGPEPDEVVKALIARRVSSVLGNHELALNSAAYFERLNPSTRESLDLTRQLLSGDSLDFCRSLPLKIIRHDALFVHGSPPASVTSYIWEAGEVKLARLFATYTETLCYYGHTHDLARFVKRGSLYAREKVAMGYTRLTADCRYLINPGSVGQPRDGLNNLAKYGIWDPDRHLFENRAVAYDVETTIALLKERKFPEFNALRLLP